MTKWILMLLACMAASPLVHAQYLVAANRTGTRVKSGREWELPYAGYILQSLSLDGVSEQGKGTITIETTAPAGNRVICKLFYGFNGEGKLSSALTVGGCLDK